jgi:hypothetical protein
MNRKTDTTRELPNLPRPHGGWREGSGRKKGDTQTKTIRVDVRLLGIMEALKTRLRNGAMNESDLKTFEDLAAN